jgi:hypothetical protein
MNCKSGDKDGSEKRDAGEEGQLKGEAEYF